MALQVFLASLFNSQALVYFQVLQSSLVYVFMTTNTMSNILNAFCEPGFPSKGRHVCQASLSLVSQLGQASFSRSFTVKILRLISP
jgi:hypothetical protein